MNSPFVIGIIDDDPGIRKAMERLLRSEGFSVRAYPTARKFLDEMESDDLDCLILDLAMPGESGIELQRDLIESGNRVPIIFLTGEGDIPSSVTAMKAGAVDFLTKPVDDAELFRALEEALRKRSRDTRVEGERERLRRVSPREFEVFRQVITGKLNKQIAADLGISEQTVKVHRMRLTEKLGVPSVAELVRLADRLGIKPADR